MKKVLLLGATGMLGHEVLRVLDGKYAITAFGRAHFEAADCLSLQSIESKFDFVINAIGITIPFAKRNLQDTYFVNGMFPHILSSIFGERLIHITTDCVFSGQEGAPYDENSPHSPIDSYGGSKSRGEPKHSITLRTSIIGRETHGYTGLLEWFLKQKGKTVKGYTEHYWNGITTTQFGKVCDRIMSPWKLRDAVDPGIYHVFGETVSKYQMLCAFKEKYKVDCEIVPDASTKLNRTLSTIHGMNDWLEIPSFAQMIEEMP